MLFRSDFIKAIEKFHQFLVKCREFTQNINFKINPTQLFALFYHIVFNEYFETALLSHMKFWSSKGGGKWRNIWESTPTETRQQYFYDCLVELSSFNTEIEQKRIPIAPKLRKEVWVNTFGDVKEAKCRCGEVITLKSSQIGHIKPVAREGTNDPSNLLPICSKCNKSMGVRNLNEYFESEYGETK